MVKSTTLKVMKHVLMRGALVAALSAVIGLQATVAAQRQRLWSIVVHLEYQDGSELDYLVQSGIDRAAMADAVAACGSSHWAGSVVRYHCYPVPE
jgi:hypothetical protein